ncbi:MAG: LysE family transporter [Spirosomataceae bacterium]|jgi:L-lysine exporter family protein LysE/ArgO
MLSALIFGLITGVLLCSTFGTVFFSLVQTSVDNGFRDALKIVLGVIVCDIIFVFFAIYGTAMLPEIPHIEKGMASAGVLFLASLGLVSIFKGRPKLVYPKSRVGNFFYYFTTGFLLNGLNPVNFISWVALASYVRTSLLYTPQEVMIFFIASLVAVFLTESLIAFFARKFKEIFTPQRVLVFNRVTGFVFLGIAGQLFYKVFLAH